ncbi:MAG: peptide-methionine (S)-S-oxide reductase MsrA [Mycobacteriaceae bacterium]
MSWYRDFFPRTTDAVRVVEKADALPGRTGDSKILAPHFVHRHSLFPPFPEGMESAVLAAGCFWGAERVFWRLPGVYVTAAGYAGGFTPNPTYEEVCSGLTGHTESVLVIFDPHVTSFAKVLGAFWESHDPTQGMRQGNDHGTQYRSAIFTSTRPQLIVAQSSAEAYGKALKQAGKGLNSGITTEISQLEQFYYAEEYHQQYLAKNPQGYCGLGGTGVACVVESD